MGQLPKPHDLHHPIPGLSKHADHLFERRAGIDVLAELGLPVLVGVSRKSMFGTLLDRPAEQRVAGGLAAADPPWSGRSSP